MQIADWAERWNQGRIGFHEAQPNALLVAHADELVRDGAPRRILVPLCGKSEDLAFLAAQGHDVVGVEAVEDAVRAFFGEHALVPEVTRDERFVRYSASVPGSSATITLLAGDVFALTKADVGPVDGLYDRAALVALPPAAQPRYVRHLRDLIVPGARGLLVAFDYVGERLPGPPFGVDEAGVHALFEGMTLTLVGTAPGSSARSREAGVTAIDRCFALEF